MPQPIPVHTVAIFPKIQADTIAALFLLKAFGESAFPGIQNAQLKFWANIPDNQDPLQLEKDGYLLLDLGGMFDHHTINQNLGQKKECLSTLVAKHLGIENHPALRKLLAWAKRDDLEGKGTISNDLLDRAFGLSGLIMNLNRTIGDDPLRIVNLLSPLINAHVQEEYKRNIELPKLWRSLLDSKQALPIPFGKYKAVFVNTSDTALAGYLRHRENIDLVIVKNPSGHINFITKQDSGIDLKPILAKLRQKEAELNHTTIDPTQLQSPGRITGADCWYYDTAANTIQNGGFNSTGINPTTIPEATIIEIVKSIFSSTPQGQP